MSLGPLAYLYINKVSIFLCPHRITATLVLTTPRTFFRSRYQEALMAVVSKRLYTVQIHELSRIIAV